MIGSNNPSLVKMLWLKSYMLYPYVAMLRFLSHEPHEIIATANCEQFNFAIKKPCIFYRELLLWPPIGL